MNQSLESEANAVFRLFVGVGDHFNGAPVKGMAKNRVKSICYAQGDVRGGEFAIARYHGAYMSDNSVSTAVSFLMSKTR